jgi:hypothetical protein
VSLKYEFKRLRTGRPRFDFRQEQELYLRHYVQTGCRTHPASYAVGMGDLSVGVERPCIRRCIQTFPDWVGNEMYSYLWYYSLRSNIKGYGHKTHYIDSQNRDTTAPSGRELYHLQFSLQAASPETFGYTLVYTEVKNEWNYTSSSTNTFLLWRLIKLRDVFGVLYTFRSSLLSDWSIHDKRDFIKQGLFTAL